MSHDEIARLVEGALWCERSGDALVPVRLPDWARREVPNRWAHEMFRMASGVRLAFTTTATSFELDLRATVLVMRGGLLEPGPVVFDLFVDGADFGAHEISAISTRVLDVTREPVVVDETPPRPATLAIEGLPARAKDVELWFPANAVVELTGFRADAAVSPLERSSSRRWIHYGSSISHGRELRRPTLTWPAVAARLAGVELVNLGVGGNCHLDPFVARAIRDAPADVVSLEVGTNIAVDSTFTRRTYAPALHGFIDTVRDGHPAVSIVVASAPTAPVIEDAVGPLDVDEAGRVSTRSVEDAWQLLSLRRLREITRDVVETRAATDPNLVYVDGLELFGSADVADLTDGFHPSEAGHRRLGERFARMLQATAR